VAVLLAGALVAARSAAAAPATGPLCAATALADADAPRIAVLSAFPAELAPLVAATEIDAVVDVEAAQYYTGRLHGVRVVLGLLGIGMVNARAAAERVLGAFEVAAVVVSGVAGSEHRIGDVIVATRWIERDGRHAVRTNRALAALVARGATHLPAPFQRCTPVPPTDPEGTVVCLAHDPAVVFERRGESGDDFGGPLACVPGGGEIFGCDLDDVAGLAVRAAPDPVDMESAAVARVAADHGVPFLAVRGVSDGAGDPLGDRGFPAQFFDYYRLAAMNAALTTRALVAELATLAAAPAGPRLCDALARRRWRRAVHLIRSAP
jgi:nucleoside phosphorylase